MDLHDERESIAFESLDERGLPQGPTPIETASGKRTDEVAELAHTPRRREHDPHEVLVQVKRGVFNPMGVADLQRPLHDAAPKRRNQVDALGKELAHDLEWSAVACSIRAFEDQNAHGVHGHFGSLRVEHRCVEVENRDHGVPSHESCTMLDTTAESSIR
jgi:hypothetical protein